MIERLLFEIPQSLQQAYASGTLIRAGALLKDAGTGKIVAHLQETGAAQKFMGILASNPAAFTNPVTATVQTTSAVTAAASSVASNVQLDQVKSMLDTLQTMQLGAMLLSGISLGVSIAGFAVLSNKIGRIEKSLEAMQEIVETIAVRVDQLHENELRSDFAHLRTACEQVDEAWNLGDPVREWRNAAASLHNIQNQFSARARYVLEDKECSFDLFDMMIEAFLLAASARISARLASEDITAARNIGFDVSKELDSMTTAIGTAEFLEEEIHDEEAQTAASRLDSIILARKNAEERARLLRDREQITASSPITISYLHSEGISGREYLETNRRETKHPISFLLPHTT